MYLACSYLEESVNPTLTVGQAEGCDHVAQAKRSASLLRPPSPASVEAGRGLEPTAHAPEPGEDPGGADALGVESVGGALAW